MTKKTLQDLAPVLEGAQRLRVPIDGPKQTTTTSSSSSLYNILRSRKKTSSKDNCCTIEVYELTWHPVAPAVNHRDCHTCKLGHEGKKHDDKALTRAYLGRWYQVRCKERDGLQRWYWDILVGLCIEWDIEVPEGCSKPTFESWSGGAA